MGMSIDGFEHLNKKWAKILAEHGEIKDIFLMQQGELLLADTKKNTPVDTGLLRANWKSTPYRIVALRCITIPIMRLMSSSAIGHGAAELLRGVKCFIVPLFIVRACFLRNRG